MMLIPTIVRPSKIQGLGLFAAQDIACSTLVCRWDERFAWTCSDETARSLPPQARAHLDRYGWRSVDGVWRLSVDDSRFLNHGNNPNLAVSTDAGFSAWAKCDIRAGEELTEDYRVFDPEFAAYGENFK